uniref:Uncharacterized protein n=1 Tax=Nelumbo nucifera TaxID=4432 RepID=A0A822Y4B7_NELNU|nr:TPA_asm: hypothetical protein HUJ06_028755 [Nelumbo nucifera]
MESSLLESSSDEESETSRRRKPQNKVQGPFLLIKGFDTNSPLYTLLSSPFLKISGGCSEFRRRHEQPGRILRFMLQQASGLQRSARSLAADPQRVM